MDRPKRVLPAVQRRLAEQAGVPGVQAELAAQADQLAELRERLAEAERQVGELRALMGTVEQHGEALAGHGRTLADHGTVLGQHGTGWSEQGATLENIGKALDGIGEWVTQLDRDVDTHRPLPFRLDHHEGLLGALGDRVAELERANSIKVFMDWIEHARLGGEPLVSVITPSRNRAAFLPGAIASVQAQTYANWELVVVDDGSEDDTPSVLAGITDPRVRVLRNDPARGVCAARNVALEAASGEVIAYLDDDNTFHPSWLKSVVWALDQRPELDVLYGAFVIDDVERVNKQGAGGLPRLFFRTYSREVLVRENLADMSAVAHRAGLPGARFDESLVEMGDWDLLCGLTADKDPLALPAIACFYTTDAPNRLSGGSTFHADADTVRGRHSARQETTR